MGKANFTDDFERDAIPQVTERGYPVAGVAARSGISKYSLNEWKQGCAKLAAAARDDDQSAEMRRLKRVTEERVIRPQTIRAGIPSSHCGTMETLAEGVLQEPLPPHRWAETEDRRDAASSAPDHLQPIAQPLHAPDAL